MLLSVLFHLQLVVLICRECLILQVLTVSVHTKCIMRLAGEPCRATLNPTDPLVLVSTVAYETLHA